MKRCEKRILIMILIFLLFIPMVTVFVNSMLMVQENQGQQNFSLNVRFWENETVFMSGTHYFTEASAGDLQLNDTGHFCGNESWRYYADTTQLEDIDNWTVSKTGSSYANVSSDYSNHLKVMDFNNLASGVYTFYKTFTTIYSFEISVWLNPQQTDQFFSINMMNEAGTGWVQQVYLGNTGKIRTWNGAVQVDTAFLYSADVWMRLDIKVDGPTGTMRIWKDGIIDPTTYSTLGGVNAPFGRLAGGITQSGANRCYMDSLDTSLETDYVFGRSQYCKNGSYTQAFTVTSLLVHDVYSSSTNNSQAFTLEVRNSTGSWVSYQNDTQYLVSGEWRVNLTNTDGLSTAQVHNVDWNYTEPIGIVSTALSNQDGDTGSNFRAGDVLNWTVVANDTLSNAYLELGVTGESMTNYTMSVNNDTASYTKTMNGGGNYTYTVYVFDSYDITSDTNTSTFNITAGIGITSVTLKNEWRMSTGFQSGDTLNWTVYCNDTIQTAVLGITAHGGFETQYSMTLTGSENHTAIYDKQFLAERLYYYTIYITANLSGFVFTDGYSSSFWIGDREDNVEIISETDRVTDWHFQKGELGIVDVFWENFTEYKNYGNLTWGLTETEIIFDQKNANMDTFIIEDNPTTNWGTLSYAYVQGTTAIRRWMYLNFSQSEKNLSLLSANISIYLYGVTGTCKLKLWDLSQVWDETAIIWNTKIDGDSFLVDSHQLYDTSDNSWTYFDFNDTNTFGYLLNMTEDNWAKIATREATSNNPYIVYSFYPLYQNGSLYYYHTDEDISLVSESYNLALDPREIYTISLNFSINSSKATYLSLLETNNNTLDTFELVSDGNSEFGFQVKNFTFSSISDLNRFSFTGETTTDAILQLDYIHVFYENEEHVEYLESYGRKEFSLPSGGYNVSVYKDGINKQNFTVTLYNINVTTLIYDVPEQISCRVAYFDPQGNYIPFETFHVNVTYIRDNVTQKINLLYDIVIVDKNTNVTLETYDRFGELVVNQTFIANVSYFDLQVTMYSFKIYNQLQKEFIHVNITRNSSYYSEWLAPFEVTKFYLYPTNYNIIKTFLNGTSENRTVTIVSDDILLIVDEMYLFSDFLSQVMFQDHLNFSSYETLLQTGQVTRFVNNFETRNVVFALTYLGEVEERELSPSSSITVLIPRGSYDITIKDGETSEILKSLSSLDLNETYNEITVGWYDFEVPPDSTEPFPILQLIIPLAIWGSLIVFAVVSVGLFIVSRRKRKKEKEKKLGSIKEIQFIKG